MSISTKSFKNTKLLLKEKNPYWAEVVDFLEAKMIVALRMDAIREMDYIATLPVHLRRRVGQILSIDFDAYDKNVDNEESDVETPISFDSSEEEDDEGRKVKKKKKVFNESTCSLIERLENEFPKFDLVLDKPLEVTPKKKKKPHWTIAYSCKPRKQRVCWNSKIYGTGRGKKTLDQQADEIMDTAAERFINWLKTLGRNGETDLTKEQFKSIFALEADRRLLASLTIEPKEVKAIAKTVADRWNVPEMALELKFEEYVRNCLKSIPKKPQPTVAFGRTIPVKDRPWQPSVPPVPIKSAFPDELLSFEKLFKGITHLRSTKALVNFYKRSPKLDRPQYLVKSGLFKKNAASTEAAEIPLYDKLKLKY